MTERDDFFARLRADARPLRYEPTAAELSRIRARIRETIERPSVVEILAAWFRPVIATTALVAAIAVFTWNETRDDSFDETQVEIVMAGDTWRVGE